MPEIDENQLAAFRTYDEFYRKAATNPATRKLLKELEKAVYPDSAVPEIDAAKAVQDAVGEQMKALNEKIEAFTKAQNERDSKSKENEIAAKWAAGQRIAKDAGYTAEGLEQLEKFMQERGIFDHDIAMPAFERIHPPAEPATTGNGSNWNFFDAPKDDNALKEYLETNNDERFLSTMIPEALKEVRGR